MSHAYVGPGPYPRRHWEIGGVQHGQVAHQSKRSRFSSQLKAHGKHANSTQEERQPAGEFKAGSFFL